MPPAVKPDTALGNWGWGALILPFMESAPLHRSIGVSTIDLARSMDVPENLGDMQRELSSYRCPSDAGPPINGERPIQSAAGLAAGLATSNYVGVNSSGELRRNGGLPPNDANGIFIINKATKLKDITDGTSKTAILGERAWEVQLQDGVVLGRGGVVFGIRGVREASEIGLADTLGCGKYQMNFSTPLSADIKADSYARRGFSSIHRGGCHFALADGSVRFIADTIRGDFGADQQTATDVVDTPWEALLGKSDGVTYNGTD